jgi:hypothetical protein
MKSRPRSFLLAMGVAFLATVMIRWSLACSGEEAADQAVSPSDSQVASGVDTGPESPETDIIELGNSICPVMGGAARANIYADVAGYRVLFCCGGCDGTFEEAPGQFLDALRSDPSIEPELLEGFERALVEDGLMPEEGDQAPSSGA